MNSIYQRWPIDRCGTGRQIEILECMVGFSVWPVLYIGWLDFDDENKQCQTNKVMHVRAISLLLLWAALWLVFPFAWAQQDEGQRYELDIPVLNVEEALATFAKQTGYQLLFPYDLAKGRTANRLSGRYTLVQGLRQLLSGTGLAVSVTENNVITLKIEKVSEDGMAKENIRKSLFTAIAAGLASMLTAPASSAQETRSPTLEEVVVTAQKRSENIQDVPVSVAAFNSRKLETFKISGIQDLAAFTPGMIAAPQAESSAGLRLSIRGIPASGSTLGMDSRVAIYVDGAYVGKGSGTVFDAIDLERVEILKGPQGTLYGRNAVSGAINLVSKKADIGGMEGRIAGGWGNYGSQEYQASINLPVTNSLAVKFGALKNKQDGWVKNHGLGKDFMGYDREGGRLDIAWEPSDNSRIDYAYEDLTAKSQPTYYQSFPGGNGGAFAGQMKPPTGTDRVDDVVTAIYIPEVKTRIKSHAATASWDWFDSHAVKMIVAHRKIDAERWSGFFTESQIDPAVGYDRIFARNAPQSDVDDHKQLSVELNFSGSVGKSVDYIAGLYYFEEKTGGGNDGYATSDVPYLESSTRTSRFETEAIAMFGQATWTPDILERRLHLTAGLRFSKDKRSAVTKNYTQVVDNSQPPIRVIGGDPTTVLRADDTWESVDPALTLKYELNDRSMIYATYSTAFRSGGFNDTATELSVFTFDKEEVEAIEVGLKSTLFDDRIQVNAAYFNYEIEGLQQVVSHPTIPTILTVGNTKAKSQGVELDITAQLTAGLTASVSYAYLDTVADDIHVAFSYPSMLTYVLPSSSAGNPRNTVSVNLDYVRPLAYGQLQVHLGYNHTDSFAVTTNDTWLGSRDLFDARIALADIPVGAGRATVAIWAQNLTDQEYHIDRINYSQFGASGLGYDTVAFGMPRTYGVQLAYEF